MATPVSPLNLERYELKYRIPLALVDEISEYVSQFCEMDYYSQISPDHFYGINSLYLDSPNLHLFRAEGRDPIGYSSFRIRSYGDQPKPPFYLESKQKFRDFCKKRRAKIELPVDRLVDLFERPTELDFNPYAESNARDFLEKCETYGLRPVVLTQYRRKAFLSHCDSYARVTFDRDLRYEEETEYNVLPHADRMTHYDHPDTFEDWNSGRNVILELKCERKIPMWMAELIRRYELNHHRFSKYQSAILEMFQRGEVPAARGVVYH